MTSAVPKRIILFAGHKSSKGDLRESDYAYLTHLARHGEVHAWYSNDRLSEADNKRMRSICESVTCIPHDELDFGSWKMIYASLGRDHVEQYDELVLTNNSNLIVRPLDDLFLKRSECEEDFFAPVLLDEDYSGEECFIDDYLNKVDRYSRSLMYCSTFWSLRRTLVKSHVFRHFISSVQRQPSRVEVSHRYERGFSRTLWRHGVGTATFLPRIYRHVPVYTEDAFMLVSMGLPIIKYKALSRSFFEIADVVPRAKALLRMCHPELQPIVREEVSRAVNLEGR